MIQEAIGDLIAGADLGRTRTRAVMDQIMSGQATDAQIGAFLVALRIKARPSTRSSVAPKSCARKLRR